jgi:predicted glutamine amidotransferase
MCLLVVCKPNAIPKREELTEGACSNPHGYGFAMVIDGKIFRYRTMSARKAVSKFIHMRQQNPQGYAIWHARYATHGVRNVDNCHPFQVGDDTDTVLAHNGVLDTFIGKDDKRSDTRIFAEDTLPKIGGVCALEDENLYRMVEGWASGSKIAVLTTNPKAQYQLYLINEKLGNWDDNGVWWSNSSYKRTTYTTTTYYSPTPTTTIAYDKSSEYDIEQAYYAELLEHGNIADSKDYLVIDTCPTCEALIDIDRSMEYCQYCDTCMSCWATWQDCMCYTPHSARSKSRDNDFDNEWIRVYNKEYDYELPF